MGATAEAMGSLFRGRHDALLLCVVGGDQPLDWASSMKEAFLYRGTAQSPTPGWTSITRGHQGRTSRRF